MKIDAAVQLGVENDFTLESNTGNNIDTIIDEGELFLAAEVKVGEFLTGKVQLNTKSGATIEWKADYKKLLNPSFTFNFKLTSIGFAVRKILVNIGYKRRFKQAMQTA